MFDYESPITQIVSDMQIQHENGVMRAVQNVGFDVNKEELAKALAYDRGQYDKGYIDGSEEAEKYKLALFAVIRNSKVMPVGMQQVRSTEEINAMSLQTMREVIGMCDFDELKRIYVEALAKMGGK